MSWLKSEICYKHGYGSPEYTYLGEYWDNEELQNVQYEIRNGPDADPEGIREPRWTILEKLPAEVLAEMIHETERELAAKKIWLNTLKGMQ